MEIRDWNGTGWWSVESVLDRYRRYAQQTGTVGELTPKERTGEVSINRPSQVSQNICPSALT